MGGSRGARWGLAAVLAAGCGASSAPGDAAVPTPDAEPLPIALSGELSDVVTRDPLAGIDVCVLGAEPALCVPTDDTGLFVLVGAPRQAELQLSFAAGSTELVPLTTSLRTRDVSDFVGSWGLIRREIAEGQLAAAGITWPEGTGIVTVEVVRSATLRPFGWYEPGISGATARIEGGPAPFYFGPDGSIDPSLEATSSGAGIAFFGLAPGAYEVTVSVPDLPCVWDQHAWPGDDERTVRASAIAGTISLAGVYRCVPPE